MILWTIKPFSWWTSLKENGRITGDLAKIKSDPNNFYEDQFQQAYGWMIEQMKQRLPVQPPNPSAYPIWAWYQRSNAKKRRPDLRSYRHKAYGHHTRIKFEIDDKLVLLSDFETWHYILNDFIIRPEEENFDTEDEVLPFTEEEKVKSWDHIFDLDFSCPLEEAVIQATFWELKLEQVKEVKEFGKNKML
jgi:hypothetical protein